MCDEVQDRLLLLLAEVPPESQFPSYRVLGEMLGCSHAHVAKVMQQMNLKKLLLGAAGKKPIGVTPHGRLEVERIVAGAEKAAEAMTSVPSVRVEPERAPAPLGLTEIVSQKFGVDPDKMYDLVARTMISTKKVEGVARQPTHEEVAMVMHAMRKYDLDPWMGQLHAFESNGKMHLMLGYNGWVKEAKKHPEYDRVEVEESKSTVKIPGTDRQIPEFIVSVMHRHEGLEPIRKKIYFLEWFVDNDNWYQRPYHRYTMKGFTDLIRHVFSVGLSDEADRDILAWSADPAKKISAATHETKDSLSKKLGETMAAINTDQGIEDAVIEEQPIVTPKMVENEDGSLSLPPESAEDPDDEPPHTADLEGGETEEELTPEEQADLDRNLDKELVKEQREKGEIA